MTNTIDILRGAPVPICAHCEKRHIAKYCPFYHEVDVVQIIERVMTHHPLPRVALRQWIESTLGYGEERATDAIDSILEQRDTFRVIQTPLSWGRLPYIDFA